MAEDSRPFHRAGGRSTRNFLSISMGRGMGKIRPFGRAVKALGAVSIIPPTPSVLPPGTRRVGLDRHGGLAQRYPAMPAVPNRASPSPARIIDLTHPLV